MATVIERADAIDQVTLLTAAEATPRVEVWEVADLVDAAARPDRNGNPVEDLEDEDRVWLPTYDLNQACARVMEVKAAKVANRFDIQIDRQGLTRSQMAEQFLRQARAFRSRSMGTVPR